MRDFAVGESDRHSELVKTLLEIFGLKLYIEGGGKILKGASTLKGMDEILFRWFSKFFVVGGVAEAS